MDAETCVRESLKLFAIDPPDTSYQHGFLDAMLILAKESLGIPDTDPDVAGAKAANKPGCSLPPQAPKLTLVKD